MVKDRFAGKKVAIIGGGREGYSLARLMLGKAEITVLDQGRMAQINPKLRDLRKRGVAFRLGPHYLENLDEFDVVFRSPGVDLRLLELKRIARSKTTELSSPTKLFFELCPAKIIGVTGTKGKSTTAAIIRQLLLAKSRRVHLVGNIGKPALDLLPRLSRGDWVVMELSSFQLEDMDVSPHIAVYLNVVREHLDRHVSFRRYVKAKSNIFAHQKKTDWLVASKDFTITKQALKSAPGNIYPVSEDQVLRRGVYTVGEEIIVRHPKTGRRTVVASVSDLKIPGEHTLKNVLPAIAAAVLAGMRLSQISSRLTKFKGLPHRLETVRKKGGVIFVNDSYATTPEAAAAALAAYSHLPVALIFGGIQKGGDFKRLVTKLSSSSVIWISLIGSSGKKIAQMLKTKKIKIKHKVFSNFEEAIRESYNRVAGGGAVLLSPGCASFDMFKNAAERGEIFKKAVTKIK